MRSATCLDDALLGQLVEGGGSGQDLRNAEEHVLGCPHCLNRLKDVADRSQEWPRPASVSDVISVGNLLSRLAALHPADATVPPDATPGDPSPFEEYQPPSMIGPFRIGPLLGSGGVGLVYAAEDTELLRPVAVKLLRPEHARNPIARKRFLDEARAVAAVVSDHIVPIYRVGEDGELPYLAMPRLEGQSLTAVLQERRKLPVDEAVDIACQLARGLATAHDRGLIHRDIKPANIWLEPGGRVKIVDFGLARFLASDIRLTQTGTIVGTPAYMAPEQADGDRVDHRCDLFSLGSVLYQILAGRLPFPGATPLAVFKAMAAGDPPRLADLDPAINARLSSLVTRLLQREPEKRPASALEVLRELQEVDEPASRPWWHRRRLLQAVGAVTAAAVGVGGWRWATRPTYYRELSLPSTGSAWVRYGLMDPEKTGTIECFLTASEQFSDAQHIIGNDSFLIFGGKGPGGTNTFELSVLLNRPPANSPVVEKVHFGGGQIEPGRRIHLAGVNNCADFRLFIDGQRVAAKILRPYLSLVPAGSFLLGGSNSVLEMRFDEVRVSSIARYGSDFVPAERHESDEFTIALYHCDETAGHVLTDSSGRGHHGTLHTVGEWVRTPLR
ncbi:MAG: protein kinase [Gemmataceae bacterium]|nr:protein kinase [Gemmataceae bacterium]